MRDDFKFGSSVKVKQGILYYTRFSVYEKKENEKIICNNYNNILIFNNTLFAKLYYEIKTKHGDMYFFDKLIVN